MKLPEPAFIRLNTPELRDELEKLGKRKNENILNNYPYEYENEKMFLVINSVEYFPCRPYYCSGINCGTNEALFLALAALREDSDYMQWFVYPEHDLWHLCREENLKHIYVEWEEGEADARTCFHKASSAELIEHFKNNE